ncbi:MAG: hypothetical protein ACREO8_03400 [Luteimonas sp.]
MNATTAGAACLLLIAATLGASPTALAQDKVSGKKLYCWNDNGRKVCGDALPANAIDNARTEISAQSGLAMRSVERSLNDDERTAATLAAKTAADAAERALAQRYRDLAMVESYATEADLRRAYGERITLVEESLKTSRLGTINLRQSLLSLLRQAAELELQSRPVRKPLADSIIRQHADLLRQQAIIKEQTDERAALGSDLEAALDRYRALKDGGEAQG